MKIKLLVSRAGPAGAFNVGDEIDVDAAEAARMFDAGQAVPVRAPQIERAVVKSKAEKADK